MSMMRLTILLSFLLLSITIYSQTKEKKTDTIITALPADTIALPDDTGYTGITPAAIDTAMIRQNISSGMDYLLKVQEENRRKQKRNAMMRIGFGLAMLVVLVIGLRRRRKV